jgi:hypothetical protein
VTWLCNLGKYINLSITHDLVYHIVCMYSFTLCKHSKCRNNSNWIQEVTTIIIHIGAVVLPYCTCTSGSMQVSGKFKGVQLNFTLGWKFWNCIPFLSSCENMYWLSDNCTKVEQVFCSVRLQASFLVLKMTFYKIYLELNPVWKE